jgi:hypothetical protein
MLDPRGGFRDSVAWPAARRSRGTASASCPDDSLALDRRGAERARGFAAPDSIRIARNLWSNLDILPRAPICRQRRRRPICGGGPAALSRNEMRLCGNTVARPDMVRARGEKPYYKTQLDDRNGASIIATGDHCKAAGELAEQIWLDSTDRDEHLVLIFGGRSRGESR